MKDKFGVMKVEAARFTMNPDLSLRNYSDLNIVNCW